MLSGLRTEMTLQSRDCTQVQPNKKNKETTTFMKPLHFCTAIAVVFSQRARHAREVSNSSAD